MPGCRISTADAGRSWRNASDEEELRFLVEVRPALQFERLIETGEAV